ncbi:MAG: hypothetical protein NTNFB02_28350 [Nitrospira sp.]
MLRAWFGALLVPLLLVAPGCKSGPPPHLIIRNDHRGLAEWYEEEATQLRSKAEHCRHLIQQYEDPLFQPSPKETKQDLIASCDTFVKYYTHAADEAETLAKYHRHNERGREQYAT